MLFRSMFNQKPHTYTQTPRLRSGGWKLTWEYASGVYGVVDLLSVAPFYVNLFAFEPRLSLQNYDHGVLAAMHFSRSLRLLKLLRCVTVPRRACDCGSVWWNEPSFHQKYRYSEHTVLFRRTLQASLPALRFFVAFSSIILFIVECITFFLERGGAWCFWVVVDELIWSGLGLRRSYDGIDECIKLSKRQSIDPSIHRSVHRPPSPPIQ